MIQVIYASSATALFSRADLTALMEKSRRYNAAHGISGMLLYHEGNFLQVLEGDGQEVGQLEVRIHLDHRHHHCLRLLRQPIAKREFSGWSMAFRDVSATPGIQSEGFSDFLQAGNDESFSRQTGRARTLLLAFKKVCNLNKTNDLRLIDPPIFSSGEQEEFELPPQLSSGRWTPLAPRPGDPGKFGLSPFTDRFGNCL